MVALVGALVSIVTYGQEASPATLKWARPEIERLAKAVEIEFYPSGHGWTKGRMSNWEVAVLLNACLSYGDEAIKGFDKEATRLAWDGWGPTAESRLRSLKTARRRARAFVDNWEAVDRLVTAFGYELDKLGVGKREARQMALRIVGRAVNLHVPKPGEVYMAFPDVPKDHWAADAVQNMRKVGVIRGYPGGRFGR